MRKLTASATLCVGLTLLATRQAEAQHKTHSGVVHTQREYVRLAEVCAFGFWCDTGILDSNNPATPPPLVSPKAKLAHGIDRSQFRPEIASYPELVVKMTHMVFGEVGRYAPLPVKIIQLETAFNRAHARAQTLAHVLLSVKESPNDGYYAIETYSAAAEPTPEEVETFEKTVLAAVLHGSNLSDVGYGPMTGNARPMWRHTNSPKAIPGTSCKPVTPTSAKARSSVISRRFHRARCSGSSAATMSPALALSGAILQAR